MTDEKENKNPEEPSSGRGNAGRGKRRKGLEASQDEKVPNLGKKKPGRRNF